MEKRRSVSASVKIRATQVEAALRATEFAAVIFQLRRTIGTEAGRVRHIWQHWRFQLLVRRISGLIVWDGHTDVISLHIRPVKNHFATLSGAHGVEPFSVIAPRETVRDHAGN